MTRDLTDIRINTHLQTKNKHAFLVFLYIFLVYGLLAMRDIFGIPVPLNMFSVLTVVLSLLCNITGITAMICSLIPLISALNLGTIVCLLTIVLTVKYLLAWRMIPRISFLLFLIPILFEVFHIFVSPFSMNSFYMMSGTYICVGLVLCYPKCDTDFVLPLKVFILSSLTFGILVLFITLKDTGYSIIRFIETAKRLGDTIGYDETVVYKITANANNLGNQCSIAICACIAMAYTGKFSTLKFIVLSAIFFIIGLLTQSRMFIVSVAFILLFSIFSFRHAGDSSTRKATRYIMVFVILIIAVMIIYPDIPGNLLGRLNAESVNPYYSRLNITAGYLKYMCENGWRMIFGIGAQSQEIKSGYGASTHNMILDVYVSWGIPGLLYAAVFFLALIKESRYSKGKPYELLAILVLLLITQSGRFFRCSTAIMLFIPSICYIHMFHDTERSQMNSCLNQND